MKKIILLILVCMCFSCKQSSKIGSGNEQEIPTETADTISAEEPEINEDFSIKFKSLEIKQFEKNSFREFLLSHVDKNSDSYDNIENVVDYVRDSPYFRTTLAIQNNTPNKITSFKLSYILKAVYADEKTEYWPYGYEASEESMLDNRLINRFGSVKQDEIWNPNEIREYYLLGDAVGCDVPGTFISKSVFERTPTNFTLIIKYKGISVDGEYTQILSYDILDSWKEYQTKLGLR